MGLLSVAIRMEEIKKDMKGYKAFYRYKDKLRCRDKIYEVGETYTENEAVLCKSGMHFCTLLIDCFIYYNVSCAVICEVETPDECVVRRIEGDSKCCTTKLKIIREIGLEECLIICRDEMNELYRIFPWECLSKEEKVLRRSRDFIINRIADEISYRERKCLYEELLKGREKVKNERKYFCEELLKVREKVKNEET